MLRGGREDGISSTLRSVSSELQKLNDQHKALTAFGVEYLGAPAALLVMTFNDEA